MSYFKTQHYFSQSWGVWENPCSSKMGVNNEREFQDIKYISWKKTDGLMRKCKTIHFISSQPLPQVAIGMLEIMKYKIPLLHIAYFPHQFYCRFTITLTSKPRKLLCILNKRFFCHYPWQQFHVYSAFGSFSRLRNPSLNQLWTARKRVTRATEQKRILPNLQVQVRSRSTSVTSKREVNHERIHQGNQFTNTPWSLKSNQKYKTITNTI